MKYVVYCDESRHCIRPADTHMAIGGLWVPRENRDKLSREFRQLARESGVGGELKWSKVSSKYLAAYKRIIDFFSANEDLHFRAIVVDQRKVDASYHGGDQELGFYKFYFRMLEKWLFPGNEYTILLDFQKNKGADRFVELRKVLTKAVPQARLHDLTVIESSETPLAQLCDVLTGAVSAAWSGSTSFRMASDSSSRRPTALLLVI